MSLKSDDESLAHLISGTLRIGVLMAVVLGLSGAILYLISAGGTPTQFRAFAGSNVPYTSVSGILHNAFSSQAVGSVARGTAIAEVGLLCLMLTPMLRVLFAFFVYVRTRDWVFVGITALVLCLLGVSVFLH